MPGPKSDKLWSDAIRQVVMEPDQSDPEKRKKLRRLASNLVDLAMQGEGWAMQEVGNRLDGRPGQAIQHQGEDGGPLQVVIKRFSE